MQQVQYAKSRNILSKRVQRINGRHKDYKSQTSGLYSIASEPALDIWSPDTDINSVTASSRCRTGTSHSVPPPQPALPRPGEPVTWGNKSWKWSFNQRKGQHTPRLCVGRVSYSSSPILSSSEDKRHCSLTKSTSLNTWITGKTRLPLGIKRSRTFNKRKSGALSRRFLFQNKNA